MLVLILNHGDSLAYVTRNKVLNIQDDVYKIKQYHHTCTIFSME